MKAIDDVRPSPIAGKWYPADPRRLAESVDRFIQDAGSPDVVGEVVAIMVPHAGHVFSGPVAGYAFAAVRGCRVQVVALVSPMHYPYPAALLTSAHAAYATPLGQVPVDQAALQGLDEYLATHGGFNLTRVANDPEHSLEIELPFLQRALSEPFVLIPVMVREHDPNLLQVLARGIGPGSGGAACSPGSQHRSVALLSAGIANQLDAEVLRRVESFRPARRPGC